MRPPDPPKPISIKREAEDAVEDLRTKERLEDKAPRVSEICIGAAPKPKPVCAASVGFEFEVGDMGVEWDNKAEDLPSKLVILTGALGTRAETDCGHVEFITDPIDSTASKDPLGDFAAQMKAFDALINGLKRGLTCQVPAQLVDDYRKYVDAHSLQVAAQKTVSATIQATIGLPLERVPDLCAQYYASGKTMVEEIDGWYREASQRGFWKARGLLFACYMYRIFLHHYCTPRNKDGPKEIFIMARTDFHSMFLLIDNAEERAYLIRQFEGVIHSDDGAAILMPEGFSYEGTAIGPVYSPTYGEWLHSILDPPTASQRYWERMLTLFEGEERANFADPVKSPLRLRKAKDLLSPPPFYQPHEGSRGFTYGMGKYGVVNGLVLFELRGLTPKIKPNFSKFRDIAAQLTEFAFLGCDQASTRQTPSGALTPSLHRVACLAQANNTCGQRAVHNALALLGNPTNPAAAQAQMLNQAALLALGPMDIDIDDNSVRRMLDANRAQQVALVSTLDRINRMLRDASLIADDGDQALYDFANRRRATAHLVINTLAVGLDPLATSSGTAKIGHYVAVQLTRDARGEIVITFADSLAAAPDRAPLMEALKRALSPPGRT